MNYIFFIPKVFKMAFIFFFFSFFDQKKRIRTAHDLKVILIGRI